MLARSVVVSYETVRQWCAKFGPFSARELRRRRPRAGDKRHLDEDFIKVNGECRYLWRAVDQDGNVPDILVQNKRDAKAAKRFLAKLMKKKCRVPRVLVTDKLCSYGTAHTAPDYRGEMTRRFTTWNASKGAASCSEAMIHIASIEGIRGNVATPDALSALCACGHGRTQCVRVENRAPGIHRIDASAVDQ